MMLDHLHSFHAVAKHLSFREAASELRLTQSAVSKQMKSLQFKLSAKLYTRNHQGIELTDAGRAALTKIEPILKHVEELDETFLPKALQEKEPVVLSIAAAFSIAANFLQPLIARFKRSHGGVEVTATRVAHNKSSR